jgi:hypothetical protein
VRPKWNPANKMANSLSGKKLIQDANLAARAVEEIGGASKLTEAEQARVNRTLTEALAKYKALGIEAPQAVTALANDTKKVEQATSGASKVQADFVNHFKATLAGMVSATAIIGGAKAAFQALTAFVGSSIQSYGAAEAAQEKLTTALESAGRATPYQTVSKTGAQNFTDELNKLAAEGWRIASNVAVRANDRLVVVMSRPVAGSGPLGEWMG